MERKPSLRFLLASAMAVFWICGLLACSSLKKPNASDGEKPGAAFLETPSAAPLDGKAGTEPAWKKEWKETVAAANRDGKLVLSGPPGESWRRGLMAFERDFPEISVEYTGLNSRDFWPRIFRERELGQYLWDLRVGGPDVQVYEARDKGALDPIRPLLLLPEVADQTKWFGGFDGLFVDKEQKYIVGFMAYASAIVYVNRDLIPETEFRSQEDLLDPRWKGKIILQDPRGGAGLGSMAVLLAAHGEQFLKDLLTKQDVVVTSDNRQQAEWVIRGRYPIGVGVLPDQLSDLKAQGLKFNVQRLREGAEGLSVGFGGVQLINRSPHPHAAGVFINWLLMQRVQNDLSQAVKVNSRRLDVPPSDPEAVIDPHRIDHYIPHQYEKFLDLRRRSAELAAKLLK